VSRSTSFRKSRVGPRLRFLALGPVLHTLVAMMQKCLRWIWLGCFFAEETPIFPLTNVTGLYILYCDHLTIQIRSSPYRNHFPHGGSGG
jgi:hypothetical protein